MITPEDILKAERNGIHRNTLYSRIKTLKWDKGRATTEPPVKSSKRMNWLKIAEENGITQSTFNARIYKYNWSYEKAATLPSPKRYDMVKWKEVAKQNGISEGTFKKRIYSFGWSYEKAATKPLRNQGYYNSLLKKAHANGVMLSYHSLYYRINKKGMTIEEAITTPLNAKRPLNK
ncbi:MAG TPA: hypothetical protein VK105_07870 [Virgibacillus sp.]|nr:hypothetical protein [Virgibacillus sp.]HLR67041.1 hypothetical protein [Virgibacillus sp.]